MPDPLFLVTGATGRTGGAIVRELLARGQRVRALVRRPDHRSERLLQAGAEIAVADLYDPGQLAEAMRGADRAYYVPPMQPYMLQSATTFAAAARDARLEMVVQMSQYLSNPAHPSLLTRQTWLADQVFAMVPGLAHTILNPGMFADNFLRLTDFAALLGIFPVLAGSGRCAPVANEDMARVAVAALLDPARHAGKRYRPTGPTLLSGGEMAATLQSVLGRRVRATPMPLWLFHKAARLQGVPAFELSGFRYYLEELRRGTFALDGGVNDVVRELTGTPAESFETTARRYAALPFARRTAANRLRAWADFLRTPVSPGYDLDRYDRVQLHPVPPTPRLSLDDAQWRSTHAAPKLMPSAAHPPEALVA